MPIAVVCHCGKRFDVPDSYAGRTGACTECKAPLVVPGATVDMSASAGQLHALAPPPVPQQPPAPTGQAAAPAPAAAAPVAVAEPQRSPSGRQQQVTIGRNLGVYELQSKLGPVTSSVFLASSPAGPVAVKVLPNTIVARSPTAGKRFVREARSLFSLNHPNVIRCTDAGEELGSYFMAMEYFEGKSLKDVMVSHAGRVPEGMLVEAAIGAAEGLGCLAANSLVHRSLQPEHILVGAYGQVKLVGLGLLRQSDGDEVGLTVKGAVVGTPQYMAPEQARGDEIDHRTDLYALGTTMYECLCGEVPFFDKVFPKILRMLTKDPPPPLNEKNPELSPGIVAVVHKLLEKDPNARYQSSSDLVVDLRAIQTGELIGDLPPIAAGSVPVSGRLPAVAPPKKKSTRARKAGGADDASSNLEGMVKKLTLVVGILAVLVVVLLIVVVLLALK